VADEVTDAAPAPTAPAPKAPPRTIVIVDESLSTYEADQATTHEAVIEQVTAEERTSDERTSDQATADKGQTDRPTIVIVDDSLIEYEDEYKDEDDQTAIDEAPVTAASAGPAADQHPPATDTKLPADASAAHDAAVARPAVTRWTPEDESPAEDPSPAAEEAATEEAATEEATVAAASPASEADALPVPTYDSLSLPSLRSRLRNLDIDQVRTLLAYERTHAARADLITMFERRIEKLASQ